MSSDYPSVSHGNTINQTRPECWHAENQLALLDAKRFLHQFNTNWPYWQWIGPDHTIEGGGGLGPGPEGSWPYHNNGEEKQFFVFLRWVFFAGIPKGCAHSWHTLEPTPQAKMLARLGVRRVVDFRPNMIWLFLFSAYRLLCACRLFLSRRWINH